MEKLFTLYTYLFLCISYVLAQQSDPVLKPNLKYGKPTKEELSLITYAPDTTATAVCLLHQGKTYFTYNDFFKLHTEQVIRVKILKSQGTSYADVAIPYYSPTDTHKEADRIEKLDGASYNMENGKIVKTALTSDLISDERVDPNIKVLKFSLPAVKAGTVIEYRYMTTTSYIEIPNWFMQQEIPVVYNQYEVTIPLVYIFNIESRGSDLIKTDKKQTTMRASNYGLGGAGSADVFSVNCDQLTFTSENLPAIKQKEDYCWCPEDYKVQISFDMQGTNFPGQEYRPISKKWSDIEKRLMNIEYEPFGQLMAMTNPFREEAKRDFSSDMTTNQKIITAFKVLRKNLAWDGTYRLYGINPSKVLKEKRGSNADLNFVLISILKDFGFSAYPVVMSHRSAGILPINYPSIQKLNTFVVAVYDQDNKKYIYLDSSMEIPTLNVLPLELTVSQAYILGSPEAEEKKWVDLTKISNSAVFVTIEAAIEGTEIKGKRKSSFTGHQALEFQRRKLHKKESADSQENDKSVFSNTKIQNISDDLAQLEELTDFTIKTGTSGDRLYVNPMIFTHVDKNPFFQTERVLPVEFPYPYSFVVSSTLTIPEGYTVEELPQSQLIKNDNNDLQCRYMIEKAENQIRLNYLFSMKSYLFPVDKYKQIQDIWTKMIDKNKATIVLKKI